MLSFSVSHTRSCFILSCAECARCDDDFGLFDDRQLDVVIPFREQDYSASLLSAHRPKSARSHTSRGSPGRAYRSGAGSEGGGVRDCFVRLCAATCMLAAIAVTAALASLGASLYGQGKLTADDAWQLVPPILAPASVSAVRSTPTPAVPVALRRCSLCSSPHAPEVLVTGGCE
jgi:hypothetical protein